MINKIAAICTTTFDKEHENELTMPEECIENLLKYSDSNLTNVILIDNASEFHMPDLGADKLIRLENNYGINDVFHSTLSQLQEYDIIAHVHMDFMIQQEGWDQQIAEEFNKNSRLALAGHVGSNEIDMAGGRGLGTRTSFAGNKYRSGQGSVAKIHGAKTDRVMPAAVLDHCSMIFRRTDLEKVSSVKNNGIAPHHFGDRIWCCEILRQGKHIITLDSECDHFSGATHFGRRSYENMALKWLEENKVPYNIDRVDVSLYKEAERIFLSKWRDDLKFIPLRVENDYSITFRHPKR